MLMITVGHYIQIFVQLFSMSIFVAEGTQYQMDRPWRASKSDRFRMEIRRKQQQSIFKSVRKEFVDSLKSLNFLEELKSQRDNLTAKKINWVVQGLRGGQNNASFYQDIIDMQLESYLCEVILNEEIQLQNKTKIMRSLVQLTYFSSKIPKQLIENNLIDFFRVELSKITAFSEVEENFAFYVASLVLNLTSFKNQSFNYHMIESDFLPVLQKLVDQIQPDREGVIQIRELLLKIYANIFRSGIKEFRFVCHVLRKILLNQRNSSNESLLSCTLSCLVEAARINKFWLYLQDQITENGEICGEVLMLAELINKNWSEECFNLYIDFLITLYEQNEVRVTQQVDEYIRQLPENFLYTSFCRLKKTPEPTSPQKKILSRLLKLSSKLQTLYKSVYHNNIQRQQYISGIMQKYIVTSPSSRKYLSRVLRKILAEDKCAVDVLINYGIIDVVRDLLDSQYFRDEKVDVIQLVQALVQAEEDLRDRAKEDNKIINVFQDRGIIRDIEKLQDDPSRDIYKRAEQFMARLSELRQGPGK